MAEIIVTCPGCSKKYKIKGSDEVLRTQNFVCRNCGLQAPFSAVQSWGDMYTGKVKDEPVSKVAESPKTQLASYSDNRHTMVTGRQVHVGQRATLYIPAIKKRIELREGSFVLGRQSSDSRADIKLAPDPYMSRDHALLQVSSQNGKQSFRLKSMNSKNPVYLNRSTLRPSDVVVLQPGDTLVMGQTTILFEVGN